MKEDKDYEYCSKTGKRCYSEREAADTIRIAKKHHGKYSPKRKYFCKYCGFWHLTSTINEHDRQHHKPLKVIGVN